MKKLILATASVLALGIASSGVGHAADPYSSSTTTQTPRSATMPPQSTQSQTSPVAPSETQVKQAQQQLKSAGLYRGSVTANWAQTRSRRSSNFSRSTV